MFLYDLWLLAVARRRLRATKLLAAAGLQFAPRELDPTRPVLHAVDATRAQDLQRRLEQAGGAAHVVHIGEQHVAAHGAAPLQRPAVRLRRIERTLELRRGLLGETRLERELHTYASPRLARAALARELRRLRRDGYLLMDRESEIFARVDQQRLAAAGGAAAQRLPHAAVLDDQARLVRGDRLLELGDPRGTLVAIHAAQRAESTPARRQLLCGEQTRVLTCFGEALLGELSRYPKKVQIDWRLGFVDRLRLGNGYLRGEPVIDDATARLMAHQISELPLLGRLATLEVEAPYAAPLVDALAALAPPRSVEQLTLVDQHGRWLGNVGELVARLPALRQLKLRGIPRLRGLVAPELRALSLETQALHPCTLEVIGCSSLPALERLDLWTVAPPGWRLDYDVLAPLLSRRSAPRLRELSLWFCDATHEVLPRLSGSPLLAALHTLELRGSAPFDSGGEWLLANARELEHLRRLRVDTRYLEDGAFHPLRRRFGARLEAVQSQQPPLPFAPPWVSLRQIEAFDRSLRA
ncbi:MAG: hypothetical protein KC503_33250 [Myxococcales bacterium]|nr:hypothetical protein [Myxococcales bacterium]